MESNTSYRQVPKNDLIQVAVSIKETRVTIDPWSNCPSQIARDEGRACNECEFWGREVQAIDWSEFTLCLFLNT